MVKKKTGLTYEGAVKRVEQIVRELEDGELPLEKALEKFEEGVGLSRLCNEKLDETEKKITILLKDSKGEVFEKPFTSV